MGNKVRLRVEGGMGKHPLQKKESGFTDVVDFHNARNICHDVIRVVNMPRDLRISMRLKGSVFGMPE